VQPCRFLPLVFIRGKWLANRYIKSLLIKSQVLFEKYFKLIFGHNTKTA